MLTEKGMIKVSVVYPKSVKIMDKCINMKKVSNVIFKLFNTPKYYNGSL